MANVICLDFDDTIVLENTTRQIHERFAAPGWQDAEVRRSRGELTVEQANAAAFSTIEATEAEMREYAVGVARPREGFLELLDWAHWNDWLPVVVSNGYDFYVDAILSSLGVDRVVQHAGRTMRDYRWRVRYYSPRGIEIEDGFKLSYATAFRAAGDFVAYVGDGASDMAAARLAPAVFARSTLLEELSVSHSQVRPFDTFHDIIATLEQEAPGWLASFSSTTAGED